MRIATCRRGHETQAICLDSDGSWALLPWADVGALLTAADDSDVQWQELVASRVRNVKDEDLRSCSL